MARILIAGCGDVGSALGVRLVQAGHQVWGLKRHPAGLPAVIQGVAADLADPATLSALPFGLDYVFYTAAAGGFKESRYRAAYVDGVRNLLTALNSMDPPIRRMFFTSSTSVYGQRGGEWVDEDSPAAAAGFAPECLRAGENFFWSGPWPATVVRFGGIYGPGRTRLIDMLRQNNAACVEGRFTNRIHRDDCAAVLQHLMNLENPAPLYLGVDDDPALQCEVLRWLALRLGTAPPTLTKDSNEGRTGGSNKRCRNARLRATGFQFRYPSYREGYEALLADQD